jgi:hypothetical protein
MLIWGLLISRAPARKINFRGRQNQSCSGSRVITGAISYRLEHVAPKAVLCFMSQLIIGSHGLNIVNALPDFFQIHVPYSLRKRSLGKLTLMSRLRSPLRSSTNSASKVSFVILFCCAAGDLFAQQILDSDAHLAC